MWEKERILRSVYKSVFLTCYNLCSWHNHLISWSEVLLDRSQWLLLRYSLLSKITICNFVFKITPPPPPKYTILYQLNRTLSQYKHILNLILPFLTYLSLPNIIFLEVIWQCLTRVVIFHPYYTFQPSVFPLLDRLNLQLCEDATNYKVLLISVLCSARSSLSKLQIFSAKFCSRTISVHYFEAVTASKFNTIFWGWEPR